MAGKKLRSESRRSTPQRRQPVSSLEPGISRDGKPPDVKTKPTSAKKRRPRQFTYRRKQMVVDFMTAFQKQGPGKYGRYGSMRWIKSLIKAMGEKGRLGLFPEDVKHWITTEWYFKNLNRKYLLEASELSTMAISNQSTSSSDSCIIVAEMRKTNERLSFQGAINPGIGRNDVRAGPSSSGNVPVANHPVAGSSGTTQSNVTAKTFPDGPRKLATTTAGINLQVSALQSSGETGSSQLPTFTGRIFSLMNGVHVSSTAIPEPVSSTSGCSGNISVILSPSGIVNASTSGAVPRPAGERVFPANNDSPNFLEEWHNSAARFCNAVQREQNASSNAIHNNFPLDVMLPVTNLQRSFLANTLNN